MIFQASEFKERNFLELNDDSHNPIHPTYSKGRVQMKFCGTLNLLYTHITRMITNHALIDKYRLRFFSKESIAYLCGQYPIEMKRRSFQIFKIQQILEGIT